MFERELGELPAGIRKPIQDQLEEAVRELAQKMRFAKFGEKHTVDPLTLTQMCAKIALCLEFAERFRANADKDLPS